MSFNLEHDRINGIAHLPQCRTCGARIASAKGIVDGQCCWCRGPILIKRYPDGSWTEDRCGARYRVWPDDAETPQPAPASNGTAPGLPPSGETKGPPIAPEAV